MKRLLLMVLVALLLTGCSIGFIPEEGETVIAYEQNGATILGENEDAKWFWTHGERIWVLTKDGEVRCYILTNVLHIR